MSKLQNNFTTPEQSKRLLELGVPKDSADCYTIINNDVYNKDEIRLRQNEYEINYSFFNNKHYNPCWSVGRLIEIYGFGTNQHIGNIWYRNPMECIIADIEIAIENGEMDFSKLRE